MPKFGRENSEFKCVSLFLFQLPSNTVFTPASSTQVPDPSSEPADPSPLLLLEPSKDDDSVVRQICEPTDNILLTLKGNYSHYIIVR